MVKEMSFVYLSAEEAAAEEAASAAAYAEGMREYAELQVGAGLGRVSAEATRLAPGGPRAGRA